mmetsp:Transcript_82664/g.237596  ORF Transcript_82664/g.237596 Transcript_82664/m.237596 type:complete len:517 (+) Transcript_82664:63-1613(+)
MRTGLVVELPRNLLELHGLGVELRRLDELQEEVGQPPPQAHEGLFGPAAVEHIGLAVDEVHDLPSEVAVELLHGPLHVQQHVQALVHSEQRQAQAAVQVHQFLGTRCVRGVHRSRLPVALRPDFGIGHRLQFFLDLGISVLRVCLNLQLVDGLQELGLPVQQLPLRRSPRRLIEARLCDAICLVQAPSLELLVEDVEVLEGLRVHPPLHLALVPQVSLQLPAFRLLGLQLEPLVPLLPQLVCAPAGDHASSVALDHHALLQDQRRLVGAAEIGFAGQQLKVIGGVDEEAGFRHLRAVVFLALCRPGPVLVGLHLTVKADGMNLLLLKWCCLRDGVMKRRARLLIPEATHVRFLRDGTLHMHCDNLLRAVSIGHPELQRVRHDIILGRLLLVIVYPELDADAVTRLDSEIHHHPLVGEQFPELCGSRQIHQEERILGDAQLILQLNPYLADGPGDVDHLRLPVTLWQDDKIYGDRTRRCIGGMQDGLVCTRLKGSVSHSVSHSVTAIVWPSQSSCLC